MGYAYVELPVLRRGTAVFVLQHGSGSLRCVLLTHAEFDEFLGGRVVPAHWLSVQHPEGMVTTPEDGEWVVLVEGDADFEVQVHDLPVPIGPGSQAALDALSRLSGGTYQPTVTATFNEVPIATPRPPGFVGPVAVEDLLFPSDLLSVAGAAPGLYGQGPAKPVDGYPGVTQQQIVTRDRTPVGVITYGIDGQPGRPVSPGVAEVKVSDQNPKFALFRSDGSPGAIVSWGGWGDRSWADFLSGIGKIGEFLYPVPEVYRNIQNWEDISTGEKIWTGVDILGMLPGAGVVGKVLIKGGRKVYRLLKPADDIEDAMSADTLVPKFREEGRTPHEIYQGRDTEGKYLGTDSASREYEREALLRYAAGSPALVIMKKIRVKITIDGKELTREYDGLVRNKDGTYTGLEHKSTESAGRRGNQKKIDDAINGGAYAEGRLPGGELIRIVRVLDI